MFLSRKVMLIMTIVIALYRCCNASNSEAHESSSSYLNSTGEKSSFSDDSLKSPSTLSDEENSIEIINLSEPSDISALHEHLDKSKKSLLSLNFKFHLDDERIIEILKRFSSDGKPTKAILKGIQLLTIEISITKKVFSVLPKTIEFIGLGCQFETSNDVKESLSYLENIKKISIHKRFVDEEIIQFELFAGLTKLRIIQLTNDCISIDFLEFLRTISDSKYENDNVKKFYFTDLTELSLGLHCNVVTSVEGLRSLQYLNGVNLLKYQINNKENFVIDFKGSKSDKKEKISEMINRIFTLDSEYYSQVPLCKTGMLNWLILSKMQGNNCKK